MAVSLQITNLAKSFNDLLFKDVNLSVFGSQKIALIGDNGSGKSTFLKMLAGLESVEQGEISWSKEAKVGYLEQEIVVDAYQVSGGEQKIIKLANLFYSDYNVLLLDEPDNHLDLDHKIWFENLVEEFAGLVIVISHDRSFLKTAITTTWQLEEKQLTAYPFGYDKFKQIYEQETMSRQHLWQVQERERLRLADIVVRFRIRAAANSKLSKSYHGAVKRYEKFVAEMVAKPLEKKRLDLELDTNVQHKRKTAIHLKGLGKSYSNNRVLTDVNLHVFCKEKIAIAAPNGSGKSTLLNVIAGRDSQDSGEYTLGPGLKIGYYAQEHQQALDEQTTLIEELQKTGSFAWFDAIAYLHKFLFSENQAKNEVRFLSGGQKSRLQLAKFLSTNPDILILDEPTNHLDLRTVLALENFLKDYAGTLILVSHDRELVNHVVDKTYSLENGTLSLVK